MNEFTVNIPMLPSALLKPGAHHPWWALVKAKQADTDTGMLCALRERRPKDMPWAKCSLAVTFVVATERKRDRDNFSARLKGFLDGVVRAGVIVDDNSGVIESMTLDFEKDKRRAPATVLRFTQGRS